MNRKKQLGNYKWGTTSRKVKNRKIQIGKYKSKHTTRKIPIEKTYSGTTENTSRGNTHRKSQVEKTVRKI